jgi:hypothetical protein
LWKRCACIRFSDSAFLSLDWSSCFVPHSFEGLFIWTMRAFLLVSWVGALNLVPVWDGCWLVGVPAVAGPRHRTDGDPAEPGHCSCSRPVPCSAVISQCALVAAKSAHMVLRCSDTLGSVHSWLFDDDMLIGHHALPDHEFVFGPLPTVCFCHVSLGGGPCTDAKTLESGLRRRQLTFLLDAW